MYVSEHGEANKAGACGFTWHRVHNLVPLHEHMQLAWIYGSSRNICGSYSEPLKQRKDITIQKSRLPILKIWTLKYVPFLVGYTSMH